MAPWARDRQQLLHKTARLQSRFANFFSIFAGRMARIQACHQQIAIEQHTRKNVIEIVRNSPR